MAMATAVASVQTHTSSTGTTVAGSLRKTQLLPAEASSATKFTLNLLTCTYIYIYMYNNLTVRLRRSSVIFLHSLYRAPEVSVSAPEQSVSDSDALCQGPTLLCVWP